jgi:hypothetical protein
MPHVTQIARFERLFRKAGGLDVDKEDLRRYQDFVDRKVYALLVRAQEVASLRGHDQIEPLDLPITAGMGGCIDAFQKLDEEIELLPILDRLARFPELDLDYALETKAWLPHVVGGLSVALARSFHILEPGLKNPQTKHWEHSIRMFDLLL